MKILGTVQFGNYQVTQAWEYLDSKPDPYLVVLRYDETDKDIPLVIKLKGKSVKDFPSAPMAERTLLGTVDIKDAFPLKSA